jgi:hypothetical protein
MTDGTADTGDTAPTQDDGRGFLTGHDHPTRVMTAVVALALVGVLAAAALFVTMAALSPRPVL